MASGLFVAALLQASLLARLCCSPYDRKGRIKCQQQPQDMHLQFSVCRGYETYQNAHDSRLLVIWPAGPCQDRIAHNKSETKFWHSLLSVSASLPSCGSGSVQGQFAAESVVS